MKKRYLLLLLSLSFTCFSAQGKNDLDSLKAVLQSGQSDTAKLQAYISLTQKLAQKNDPGLFKTANAGIRFAASRKDSVSIAQIVKNIAAAYLIQGKRDSATLRYYQAAGIFERNRDELKAADAYTEMAKIYRADNIERALYFYNKAYDIYKKAGNQSGQAVVLNESGVAFENKGDLDEAIRRYSASLALQRKLKDSTGMGYALEFLSGAYLKKKDFSKSKRYLLAALAIRTQLKDTFALAINYTNLGEFYQTINSNEEAISNFLQSNELAKKIHYLNLMSYNYGMLSELYQGKGDYKAAIENMKLHVQLKDSIYNTQSAKQIEEISVKYETEKNKLLIKGQQLKILKRNYVIAAAVFALLALIGISFSTFRSIKHKNETRLQQAIIKGQELSAKAILNAEEEERKRIALDLHDGIGQLMSAAKMNLSTLESHINFQDKEEQASFENAIYLVDESCKEIRFVAHNLMPNALLKNSLAAAIRDFVNKLDKRLLQVHLYVEGLEERLDLNLETVLYRVVQECIHNVIKHSEATKLDISILKEAHEINVTIEDNGKGFDLKNRIHFEGIGLKNISSRIQYLKGTVDFDSAPGKGTLVAIHIPLEKQSS